jgi:hypothetical protein
MWRSGFPKRKLTLFSAADPERKRGDFSHRVSDGWSFNFTMKPLIYRHRPAFPALVGAAVSLVGGALCFGTLYDRVMAGEISQEKLTGMIMAAVAIAGIFLIAAFARYQFTHLWLKPRHKAEKNRSGK